MKLYYRSNKTFCTAKFFRQTARGRTLRLQLAAYFITLTIIKLVAHRWRRKAKKNYWPYLC